MTIDLLEQADTSQEGPPANKQRLPDDCSPLLDAARLNIYRNNAFRIMGLPVDASTKEMLKRADKLKMMEQLGHRHEANTTAFALEPSPTVDEIREAIQRLREPERRLIDEFFWFWPGTFGDSASDPAIQALMRGDSSRAYEIWAAAEDDPAAGFVAIHNIAVMLHLVALDWTIYHIAAEVQPEREEQIRHYWKEAFKRWEKVVSDDRVWNAVKTRIRSMDDARLTTGFARRLCDTLPEAMDKINAEAALLFAEQHRLDWTKIHIAFMNETHQGLDNVEKTAASVLMPTRKRVLQHIATAKEQASARPDIGHKIAETLLCHSEALEELFELFHGKNSHHKTELFDEVADTANAIIVAYRIKASGDLNVALPLYRRTLHLATSIEVRTRIQNNITKGANLVKAAKLQPLYERLKAIQESNASARCRLNDMMPLISELAQIAKDQGDNSEPYIDLVDSIAIVLRGIAVAANNDDKDPDSCLQAVKLALTLARTGQLRERIEHDLFTASQNKAAAELIERRTRAESACRIVVIVCILLGAVIGMVSSGSEGALGGAFVGLMGGVFVSRFIKAVS